MAKKEKPYGDVNRYGKNIRQYPTAILFTTLSKLENFLNLVKESVKSYS